MPYGRGARGLPKSFVTVTRSRWLFTMGASGLNSFHVGLSALGLGATRGRPERWFVAAQASHSRTMLGMASGARCIYIEPAQ